MIVAKAVKMANMMHIPVLGFVENYSYLECPDCGKKINVFGDSRLDEVAEAFNLPVLARLPIDPMIAQSYDSGMMETVKTDAVNEVITAIENAQ
jgi:Mrp family chromosome partitioning ATPase